MQDEENSGDTRQWTEEGQKECRVMQLMNSDRKN